MCLFLLMFLLFYLRSPRFIQPFLLSSHLDSDPGVKEEGGKKIQTGYSKRDHAILDLVIRQRKWGS